MICLDTSILIDFFTLRIQVLRKCALETLI
jgi:hypothetical protein